MWIIFLAGLNYFLPHAFYVGVIDLVHKTGDHKAEMVIKVFTDDLEDALVQGSGSRFVLSKAITKQHAAWPNIEKYFTDHIQIMVNQQEIQLQMVQTEVHQDSHWIYFEGKCAPEWQNVTIKAEFFMDLFPDQMNVVHFKEGTSKHYLRLSKSQKRATVLLQ